LDNVLEKIFELIGTQRGAKEKFRKALNIQSSALGDWKSGKNKSYMKRLPEIAEYFGVSADYLLGRDKILTLDGVMSLPKTKKVPLVGTIACGTPILAVENIDGFYNVPETIEADFCLRCKGDSMSGARILEGDIVYIKHQDIVDDGEIAAVLIDNEATLKRVYYQKGKSLVLSSENPAFPPMIFTGEQLDGIQILGRAVAFHSIIR